MKQRFLMFLSASVLGLGALAGIAATPAHAAGSTDVTCTGTESDVFSPGLLLSPREVTVTVSQILGPCESTDPTVTAGLDGGSYQEVGSCINIDSAHSGTLELYWSNDQYSTFNYNVTTSTLLGQTVASFSGAISAGEFAGDTADMTVITGTLNVLNCLAPPGVTSTSGAVTLELTRS
jgi:hypothetical protein